MSDDNHRIDASRLRRDSFKAMVEARYSERIGGRIINFIDAKLNSLFRMDFVTYLTMITDLLNQGPVYYQMLVFTCFSLSNPGIICEHDIFNILEEFKQQESTDFYKDLLGGPSVPRNYQNITDKSDIVFFDVFLKDL